MRSLLRSEHPSTLARALSELGRINKTLYLLPYIDDEAFRRRILVQLNRHEGCHVLARDTFHGRRGEVRQRYREGQEDQLGALGLVVNAVILWNTLYLETALNHLHAGGAASERVEPPYPPTARMPPAAGGVPPVPTGPVKNAPLKGSTSPPPRTAGTTLNK